MANWSKLIQTKSPDLMVDEASHSGKLKQSLDIIDLIAFGIGATIGSGIFALVGQAAAGTSLIMATTHNWLNTPVVNQLLHVSFGRAPAGPSIVLSFVLAAIACGFAALCYAELASMIPVSGSAYTYAYASLGQFAAWVIGWNLILEYVVGNIAVSISWSEHFIKLIYELFSFKLPLYLTTNLNDANLKIKAILDNHELRSCYSSIDLPTIFGFHIAFNLPALVIVSIITLILVLGVKESAIANKIILSITITAILYFIFYGATQINTHNWFPFAPGGVSGILGGAGIVFFSFIGFDAVSSMAEETKNPQRDLPLGMIGALSICTIIYSLVALVLTGIKPYSSYVGDSAPLASAMILCHNHLGNLLISIGALSSMTSVLLVFQLGLPRIVMVIARDGLVPKVFAQLHPKFKTPYLSTILMGVVVAGFAIFMDIGDAAELTNIGTLFVFALVCLGVLILRKTAKQVKRGFHCPFVPLIPVLGMLTCFLLMLSLQAKVWIYYLIYLVFGVVIYFSYGFKKS